MKWPIALALLPAAAFAQSGDYGTMVDNPRLVVPPVMRELRGAWVATVWNIDWPTTRNNVTSQRTQMNAIFTAAERLGLNALFLQVRPQCDALYPSSIEPWSYFLTGRMGRAPSPSSYDPLAEWIAGAHQRGISLYAWFNPYRALVQTPGTTDAGFIAANHVVNSQPSLVVDYAGDKWLDPGKTGSAAHSKSVIMDVVNRYDVDGVVFDDYFYPYPDGNAFPDSSTYSAYLAAGGTLSLGDWRRQNVNTFVFDLYQSIKLAKPQVHFGVGPFGIWKSGVPSGVVGLSSYNDIYCDSKLWLNNGWVDFLAPQLYWKISAPQQPYVTLMNWWASQNTMGRHLWISNFASKVDGTATGWPVSEIVNQISETRNSAGASGNVHFSIRALRDNWQGLADTLDAGVYADVVLPPASPWIENVPAGKPTLGVTRTSTQTQLTWSATGTEPVRSWAVALLRGANWEHRVLPPGTLTLSIGNKNPVLRAVAVQSVDRQGNVSEWSSRVFDGSALQNPWGD